MSVMYLHGSMLPLSGTPNWIKWRHISASCIRCTRVHQKMHTRNGKLSWNYYHGTIMEKSSAPSSLERNQFETVFRSEVMPLFRNEPITMVPVH